jgi:hypothetical protein
VDDSGEHHSTATEDYLKAVYALEERELSWKELRETA